jgi:UDP-4-amino-4,6-dideoxy-N-acetyl-beta-L-altrosamine transaminase
MKYFPYGHQYISKGDVDAVVKVLQSDYLTQGTKIPEFEKLIAKTVGSRYAVVFNSGTSALHAAYFASGLGKKDEFITTPMTFVATSNAGLYLGATPIFVDIDPKTGNIDTDLIENKITKKTKAIMPVHYSGYPVNLIKIHAIAKKYHLKIIDDASHALGAKYKGEKIGNCKYSDMSVFSFHPVKHITTGEGGAVTTNSKDYFQNLLVFRTHGISKDNFIKVPDGEWYYEMQLLGYNYRLTDFQAALGISQLARLKSNVQRRREIANIYDKAFCDNPYFDYLEEKDKIKSAYHLYTIRLKDSYKELKKEIFSNLRKGGLGVQVHYIPVYLHPYYQNLNYKKGMCSNAEDFYQKTISIPMFPSLKNSEINYIIRKIFEVLKSTTK